MNQMSWESTKKTSQGIIKDSRRRPLRTMNVCTRFHGSPSKSNEIIQSEPKRWSDQPTEQHCHQSTNRHTFTYLWSGAVFLNSTKHNYILDSSLSVHPIVATVWGRPLCTRPAIKKCFSQFGVEELDGGCCNNLLMLMVLNDMFNNHTWM